MTMKTCSKCNEVKPPEEFHRHRRSKDGLQHWCKGCSATTSREWYATNRNRSRETMRKWRAANKDREREYGRRWRAANPAHAVALASAYQGTRSRFIRSVKLTCGCIDCDYRDDPAKLDFDHRPGTTKLFSPGNGVSRGWPKLIAEIEKCDVRCRSCHVKRHMREARPMTRAEIKAMKTTLASAALVMSMWLHYPPGRSDIEFIRDKLFEALPNKEEAA